MSSRGNPLNLGQIREESTLEDSRPDSRFNQDLNEQLEGEGEEQNFNDELGRFFDISILTLCLIGIGISGILFAFFSNDEPPCSANSICGVTQPVVERIYYLAQPLSLFALGFYLILFSIAAFRAVFTKSRSEREWSKRGKFDLALFLVSLGSAAYTAFLLLNDLNNFSQVSPWILGYTLISSIILILSVVRLVRA